MAKCRYLCADARIAEVLNRHMYRGDFLYNGTVFEFMWGPERECDGKTAKKLIMHRGCNTNCDLQINDGGSDESISHHFETTHSKTVAQASNQLEQIFWDEAILTEHS